MSLFKKNIAATYAAQVITLTGNFICAILAARMLGDVGQGDLTLYTIFTAFAVLLMGLGLPSAVVYFLAAKKTDKGKMIPLCTSLTLLLMSVFVLCYFLTKQLPQARIFLPEFVLRNNLWSLVLIVHVLLMMMNQFFVAILQAENRFAAAGIVSVTGTLLLLLLYSAWYSGTIVYYFGATVTGLHAIGWILASMMLSAGVQYFLYMGLIFRTDRSYFSFLRFRFAEVKPLLLFAGIAYLANLVQFLSYKMDAWFLNYFFHDKGMVGVYGLGATLAQLVWHLPIAVHSVLFTWVAAEENPVQQKIRTKKISGYLLLYALGAGITGYFLSRWLIPLWFGEAFTEASALIGILLVGIVPFCYGMGISAYFAGIQKVQINMQGSVIGLIFCLLADLALIPSYGMYGAAWASVISYISTVVFYFYQFRKLRV